MNASANGLPWLVARDRVDLEADGEQLVVAEEDELETGAGLEVMLDAVWSTTTSDNGFERNRGRRCGRHAMNGRRARHSA